MQIEIVGVRTPPGSAEKRNPIALVSLSFGDVIATFAVVALKGRKVTVRAPKTPDGLDGVILPMSLEARVRDLAHAAAMADPTARAALTRHPSSRRLAR